MKLNSEDIELAWDSQSCWFQVLHNGQRQRVPGRDDFASIGPKIQKIISDKASAKVLLKCAAYPLSNGNILIDFGTLVGKEDFIVQVLKSTRPVPDRTNYDHEHFKKTFQKLSEEFSTRPAHRAQPDHVHGKHQPSHEVSDIEEKIVYETAESDEERSADSTFFRDQTSKPAMFGHESYDTRRKPEDDEATRPSFRGEDRRVTRRSLGVSKPVARSTTPPRWTQCNDLTSWRHSVVYPPLPALRRVTIDKEDIGRLDEGEFLNDTILSFALREIEESMAPRRRDDIYMFNTFFYTALSTKLGRKAFNFDAVKSWTRKVDIFKYPFVVVPINVSLHWFVAIICNLPSVRSSPQDDAAMDDVEEVDPVDDRKQHPLDTANVEAIQPSEPDDDPKSSQPPNARMSQLSLQDGDEKQSGDARAKKLTKTRKYGSKKHAPPVKKINPKGPFIITLDSLNLARSPEVRYLKDYIAAEAMDKLDIVLDPKEFQGVTAKGIPEQNNFCDCGIFAVRYIRALAEDPHGFVKDILDRRVNEERFEGFNPSKVRDELRSHLLELSRVNEEEFKAKRGQKHQLKRGALQRPDKHDPPATSPVEPTGKGGESPETPETPAALDLAGAHPSTDSTIRASTQRYNPEVISPPLRPHHKVSLSHSSTPSRPISRDTNVLEF
jgi:sentrin-specific protease 7